MYAQPEIDLSDINFEFNLNSDELASEVLSVTNSGEPNSYLSYTILSSPFSNQQSIVDDFGYAWSSSDVDDYIEYDWIDITSENFTLEIENNDQAPGYFDLDFNFYFLIQRYHWQQILDHFFHLIQNSFYPKQH